MAVGLAVKRLASRPQSGHAPPSRRPSKPQKEQTLMSMEGIVGRGGGCFRAATAPGAEPERNRARSVAVSVAETAMAIATENTAHDPGKASRTASAQALPLAQSTRCFYSYLFYTVDIMM